MGNSDRESPAHEDDLLVREFIVGHRAAFDELYNKYKMKILNYIHRKIGDRATAEELTQETFVNVYVNIARYRPRGLFKAWVYTIASNLAKNELNRKSRTRGLSIFKPVRTGLNGDVALADVLYSEKFSPEVIASNRELKREIERCLGSLPPIYSEALLLCVIEGLSYEEAAAVLGTNVKTVSSRLARARRRFIEEMKRLKEK